MRQQRGGASRTKVVEGWRREQECAVSRTDAAIAGKEPVQTDSWRRKVAVAAGLAAMGVAGSGCGRGRQRVT